MQKQAISPPLQKTKNKKNQKKKNHRSSSLAHFQTELSSIHTLILMFGPQAQKRPEMKSWKQYRMHEWDYTLHPRYMQHKMMQKRWEGGKKNHKECTRISVWRSRSSGLEKKKPMLRILGLPVAKRTGVSEALEAVTPQSKEQQPHATARNWHLALLGGKS